MVPKILCKPQNGKAYPVQLKPLRFGNTFVINIEGDNQPPIQLAGSPKTLVPFLRSLLEAIESESDYRPGPIEASPPGIFGPKITPDDVAEADIGPELPPGDNTDRIPDVRLLRDRPPEEQKAMLIEHFNAAPPGVYDAGLVDSLRQDYRKEYGRRYVPRKKDEIGQAVARLLPHRAELLDEAGQPRHGAKSEVARIMQFKQSGGGFARKIDLYLAALAEAA